MIDKWEDRWEWLRLSKDTFGFLLGWAICNFLHFFFVSIEKKPAAPDFSVTVLESVFVLE